MSNVWVQRICIQARAMGQQVRRNQTVEQDKRVMKVTVYTHVTYSIEKNSKEIELYEKRMRGDWS